MKDLLYPNEKIAEKMLANKATDSLFSLMAFIIVLWLSEMFSFESATELKTAKGYCDACD